MSEAGSWGRGAAGGAAAADDACRGGLPPTRLRRSPRRQRKHPTSSRVGGTCRLDRGAGGAGRGGVGIVEVRLGGHGVPGEAGASGRAEARVEGRAQRVSDGDGGGSVGRWGDWLRRLGGLRGRSAAGDWSRQAHRRSRPQRSLAEATVVPWVHVSVAPGARGGGSSGVGAGAGFPTRVIFISGAMLRPMSPPNCANHACFAERRPGGALTCWHMQSIITVALRGRLSARLCVLLARGLKSKDAVRNQVEIGIVRLLVIQINKLDVHTLGDSSAHGRSRGSGI